MLTKTCYIFSALSNDFLSWIDFYFYTMFHWVRIGKNRTIQSQKRESRLYKWSSIERGFKPSHYTMNYGVVDQPLSPDANHWLLGMLQQVWFPKPGRVPSLVWTENILIWSQYLNPVDYSPPKKFMQIARPARCTISLILLFLCLQVTPWF